MPFKSNAQRAFLYAKLPAVAEEFASKDKKEPKKKGLKAIVEKAEIVKKAKK